MADRAIEATGEVARERPLLVFFAAPRCGRARRVEGFLAQVLQRRSNHDTFRIVPVDAEARSDLVERFAIGSLPALALVEGRKVRARVEAPKGSAEIQAVLQPWLR